jgi:hypothetical protein
MYSDADLDAAVSAGALTPEAVASFRSYMAEASASAVEDEEHFRLLTGFNDVFVSIAAILILIAVHSFGEPPFNHVLTAAASWGLAEYFTRRRRMALPSILFLFSFVGSVFQFGMSLSEPELQNFEVQGVAVRVGISAAMAAAAAQVPWGRFMVPITPAVGAVAAIATLAALLLSAFPSARPYLPQLLMSGGLAIFALAMRWDISDLQRKTRRTDIAFWLHLAAAPLIIHPAFSLLGLSGLKFWLPQAVGETAGLFAALVAVAIYVGLALVALAIDRRALLVSALIYVLFATSSLLRAAGSITSSFALTALVIGSALLLLSAFWHPTRRLVISRLPAAFRSRLPAAA